MGLRELLRGGWATLRGGVLWLPMMDTLWEA